MNLKQIIFPRAIFRGIENVFKKSCIMNEVELNFYIEVGAFDISQGYA